VTNIVNNPESTSLVFVLYGHTATQRGILVTLDMAALGVRACKGAEFAGDMADSDYERWMPSHYGGAGGSNERDSDANANADGDTDGDTDGTDGVSLPGETEAVSTQRLPTAKCLMGRRVE
jgi:hypothetical protein